MAQESKENIDEEGQYAEELAAEQELYAAQSEAEDLYNHGQEFRHPSYFKYFVVLAPLAAIVDIVDAIDLTGIGAIIGRLISLVAWAVTLLILWLTNTNQKRADNYVKNLEDKADVLAARIASAEKNILRVAKFSRKIPGAKQIYRKFHLRTIRKTRIALRGLGKGTKNPIVRSAATGALNLIPFIALIPWMLLGTWLTYRAEKESINNAREASDSMLEATGESENA